MGKKITKFKSQIIEKRDTMPEIHTTKELYEMAKKDFNEKCDEIEKNYGLK